MSAALGWTRDGLSAPYHELWGERGAFTTLRIARPTRKGDCGRGDWVVLTPGAHLQRLNSDLAATDIAPLDTAHFQSALLSLTAILPTINTTEGELLARISVTENHVTLAIRPAPPPAFDLRGILGRLERSNPTRKHLDYAPVLDLLKRSDRYREEVILIDKAGYLTETCTANLIAEDSEGNWFTPGENCLPGLTLGFLEASIGDSQNPITQKPIHSDALNQVSALWCCGTGRLISGISSIPELSWSASPNADLINRTRALHSRLRAFLCNHVDRLVLS